MQTNVSKLLNDKVGEIVILLVTADPSDSSSKRRVELRAENRLKLNDFM